MRARYGFTHPNKRGLLDIYSTVTQGHGDYIKKAEIDIVDEFKNTTYTEEYNDKFYVCPRYIGGVNFFCTEIRSHFSDGSQAIFSRTWFEKHGHHSNVYYKRDNVRGKLQIKINEVDGTITRY